jgi:hypothetical protein
MPILLSNLVVNDPGENGWLGSVDLSDLGNNKAWIYAYGKTTGQNRLVGSHLGNGANPITLDLDFGQLLCGPNGDQAQPLVVHARITTGGVPSGTTVENGLDTIKGIPSIIQRDAPYIVRR